MPNTPPSSSLTKRNASSALMPPPPPPKRIKRPAHVLPEDTYESILSHIIARDYFPGLLETESQAEYLDALDSRDEEWIEESGRKVREVLGTPRQAPGLAIGESGRGLASEGGDSKEVGKGREAGQGKGKGRGKGKEQDEHDPAYLKTLSLQDFQTRYTSEDNESFNRVLDRQNAKRADKKAWLYNGNRLPSNRRIAQAAVRERQEQRLLTAAGDPAQSATASKDLAVRAGGADASDSNLANSNREGDKRPAGPAVRQEKPMNSLMFDPAGLGETHPHLPSRHDIRQAASLAPPRAVQHAATRFPNQFPSGIQSSSGERNRAGIDADAASTTSSVPISAIDRAIRTKLYGACPPGFYAHSTTDTDTDPADNPSHNHTQAAEENQYEYVDDEPSYAEATAYATHGSLRTATAAAERKRREENQEEEERTRREERRKTLGVMRALAGEHTGGNGFTIHAQSRREDLRDRLVEKNNIGARPGASGVLRTPARFSSGSGFTPGASSGTEAKAGPHTPTLSQRTPARKNITTLTPAGQALFGTLGARTPRGDAAAGHDIWGTPRAKRDISWTPAGAGASAGVGGAGGKKA